MYRFFVMIGDLLNRIVVNKRLKVKSKKFKTSQLIFVVFLSYIFLLSNNLGLALSGKPGDGDNNTKGLISAWRTLNLGQVVLEAEGNTGAATTSIPIVGPPGRKGIEPNISLNYSSINRNGWVGVGWGLDMSAIQRSIKKGVDYYADEYFAIVNGSISELVLRGDWGANYYGAKIEGKFYKYYYDSATSGWTVTSKNGTKYYFGSTVASRQDDPADASRIFKWSLDRVEDTNGNYMEIFYTKDQGEIYLDEIRYTGNTAGLSTSNSIKFLLESQPRTDAHKIYTTHFSVTTAYRLETIEVYGNGQLARKYTLNYIYSNSTNRSLLTSVTIYGTDGGWLPPITFNYSEIDKNFSSTAAQWHTPISNNNWQQDIRDSHEDGIYQNVIDMNGDSLPDRVTSGGADYLKVYLNTGSGFSNTLLQWHTPISNSSWPQDVTSSNEEGVFQAIIDMDGDGLPDRVTNGGSNYLKVYLNTGSGFSNTAIQWYTPVSNGSWPQNVRSTLVGYAELCDDYHCWYEYDATSTYQDIIDMNGDGLPDRVTNGGSNYLKVYLNTGSGFSNTYIQWHTPISNGSWPQNVSYNRLAYSQQGSSGCYWSEYNETFTYQDIIDMNGDGLPDRVANGASNYLKVYLNTGSGFSNTAIQWYTPVSNGSWPQYVRNSEMGIGQSQQCVAECCWYETQYWGPFTYQDILDLNGDGLPDRVTSNAGRSGDYLILYSSSRYSPDLLTTINNGLGGTTEIQYAPSTQYNNTFLPFIQYVVTSVTVNDGKGNLSTSTFYYSEGYYNPVEKEFRGFKYVKLTDPNGTITERWFKQDDIFKGLVEIQIIKDSSGNMYTRTENTYQSSSPYTGVDFPYLIRKDDYIYDGDNSATPRHIINQFTYDNYGNSTSKYYAENPLKGNEKTEYTEYFYDTANWIISLPSTKYVTDGNSTVKAQTWYEYYPDNKGNLWKKTEWLDGGTDPITTYEYDTYGNVNKIIDPGNNPQTTTYDSTTHTHPVEIKNALNHSTQMTYDLKFGKIKTNTDPNGNTITYDYDEFGRLIKITNPAPYGITDYLYQNYGDPYNQNVREETKDQSGMLLHWKETYFDGLERTTLEKQGGLGATAIIVDTEYNNKGLVYKKSYPYFEGGTVYKITYTYDPVDRLIQTLNPDGTSSSISYDRGWITYIDANGHKRVVEKDIYERIVTIEEYTGTQGNYTNYATTTYQYDILGNLLKTTDAQGNITTMRYDTLGRKIAMSDPDMGNCGDLTALLPNSSYPWYSVPCWNYEYDANGNLISQTDAKGQTIVFRYDALNRVILKDYPTGTDVVYVYDEPFSTNPIGKLTTMTDESGTTKFYYDVDGQISKAERTIVDDTTYITQTQYDALGRVEAITYPDNTEIDYTYDGNGNIKEIRSGAIIYITYNSYTAIGHPLLITLNNGITTGYQYLPENNRLSSITTNSPTEGLINISYQYDNIGNVTGITDNLDKPVNITSGEVVNYTYGGSRPHAVTSTSDGKTYTYDANGNVTSDSQRTITYNYDNKSLSITYNGVTTSFVYDGEGERVKKITPTDTTIYINKLYECKNGICTKYIFAGSTRVASKTDTETYYYHQDHLGSSSVVTDSSGNKVEEIHYYPFGGTITDEGSISVSHKYTSQELDSETDLYYYVARYYNTELGMFISPDPLFSANLGVSITDGVRGKVRDRFKKEVDPRLINYLINPQRLNRYAYALNNPLLYVDPDGEFAQVIAAEKAIELLGWTIGILLFEKAAKEAYKANKDRMRNEDKDVKDKDTNVDTNSEVEIGEEDIGESDDYPTDPDEWIPPEGVVEETRAGEKSGGKHRHWKDKDGKMIRRWDREGRHGGKKRGPHWHDPKDPDRHIEPTK